MIIIFDIVVPCIVYYVWFDIHRSRWESDCQASGRCRYTKPEFDTRILGYAIISFGLGELYILISRVYRLLWYPDACGLLLSRSRWELEATSWVYVISMICALIPFVIGSSKEIPKLYLYFFGASHGLPRCLDGHYSDSNQDPRQYQLAGERDPIASYDITQPMTSLLSMACKFVTFPGGIIHVMKLPKPLGACFSLLLYGGSFGVSVYLGCLSAIIWVLEFDYVGLSLGFLLVYIITWA